MPSPYQLHFASEPVDWLHAGQWGGGPGNVTFTPLPMNRSRLWGLGPNPGAGGGGGLWRGSDPAPNGIFTGVKGLRHCLLHWNLYPAGSPPRHTHPQNPLPGTQTTPRGGCTGHGPALHQALKSLVHFAAWKVCQVPRARGEPSPQGYRAAGQQGLGTQLPAEQTKITAPPGGLPRASQ